MPWREDVEPIQLFDRAQAACNMVRGDYQNPLMIYDEDMRLKELLNQRLLNDLRGATEERQLKVYYQAKYDIRSWSPDHQKMGKGITMTQEELKTLAQIINSMEN